jgi:hypothetical protein
MKTLITTPKQICALFFGPNDGEKASLSNRHGLADAAIKSVAGSELPSAEHYWRDVLPPGSLGANPDGRSAIASAVDRWRLNTWLP